MNCFTDAKLFVKTLCNDQYLFDTALTDKLLERYVFYGLNSRYNKPFRMPLIRWIMVVIYPIGLFFFLLYKTMMSVIKVLLTPKECLYNDEYFLATTNFSASINYRVNKYAPNTIWILNENVCANNYNISSHKSIKILSLISIKDILSSLISSLISYILICKQYGCFYMLCSLNAFSWLLYWHACQYIPSKSSIYFIDHKDRWAFLVDHTKCINKTLIQHGTEIAKCPKEYALLSNYLPLNDKKVEWTQNVPNKLKTLTRVISFSSDEASALKQAILDCNPEFVVSGYDFKTDALDSEKFSILIIAHRGVYFEIEKKIIEKCQNIPVVLYVKNHPTQSNDSYFNLLNKYKFIFLTEQKFPHVNLVISYDSTLANEYKSVGIEVIYHTEHSIEEIVDIIKARL